MRLRSHFGKRERHFNCEWARRRVCLAELLSRMLPKGAQRSCRFEASPGCFFSRFFGCLVCLVLFGWVCLFWCRWFGWLLGVLALLRVCILVGAFV